MKDKNGLELTDVELIREGLGALADACAYFYEIESEPGKAMAFMADSVLRYAEAIIQGRDPRMTEFYNEQ